MARKRTTRKTRQRRQGSNQVGDISSSDTAVSRQADRLAYLGELRDAVSAQREAARTWLADTHQHLNERLAEDAQTRQAYVSHLQQDTQNWLEQFRVSQDAQRHSDQGSRKTYVETLQADIHQQLNDFRADFAERTKTAQDERQVFVRDVRDETRAFLDDAQKRLLEQHHSDHSDRVAFLATLRDDIENSLSTFRKKLAEDTASDRQARRDAFDENIAAARAERARYYQRYRRDIDSVNNINSTKSSTTQASSAKSASSKTTKSKSRKSTRKSTTKPDTSDADTNSQTTASQATTDVNTVDVNTSPNDIQDTIANADTMVTALLALVEQKPGSNAATLAEGLAGMVENLDNDSDEVQRQLDGLMSEGKVKSRNRGYYLVVTPKSDDGDETADSNAESGT